MHSSGHADVLAEMAIVRMACLEDLDAIGEVVARLGSAGGGSDPMARGPVRGESLATASIRKAPPSKSDAPPGPVQASSPVQASPVQASPVQASPVQASPVQASPVQLHQVQPAVTQPAVPRAAVGPADTTAAPPTKPAASQAALLRAAASNPLVAKARDLFDGAIRRVEPPRATPSRPSEGPPAVGRSEADPDGDDDVSGATGEGFPTRERVVGKDRATEEMP